MSNDSPQSAGTSGVERTRNEDVQPSQDQRGGLSKNDNRGSSWWSRWMKQKRKINFVEPDRPLNSILSTTSIITRLSSDQKPLKSSMRSTTSSHSGSSVRFNLPSEDIENDTKRTTRDEMIGVEMIPMDQSARRLLRRRKSWRIVLCVVCGIMTPFLILIIPFLVTFETPPNS